MYLFSGVITIEDNKRVIVVSSTENHNVDVLFLPIKDRYNKPTLIGEVAHDLEDPMKNHNLRKFSQVFAEGVFRNQKLKSDFELYITGYLNNDKSFQEDILINKGVEKSHIEHMDSFIKENLLSNEEKKEFIEKLQQFIKIDDFSQFRDFTRYENLEFSFDNFYNEFDKKYDSILYNFTNEYKNYIHNKILNKILKNKEELEVLYFIQHGTRDEFDKKYDELKKQKINSFKNETDVYILFGVEKLHKNRNKYIEGKIDYEYFTDDVRSEKINFSVQSNTIEAKASPTTGDAKQSKSQTKNQEEKNEKVGLGQELKLAYKFAKQIEDKKVFIEMIKKEIYKNDEKLKDNKNLTSYYQNLDGQINSNDLEFAKNVIQIANNKLDGLGYDLIIPTFSENNEVIAIKKVELKTTKRDQNIQVHFSDNEIKRALHYMEVDNWEVWLNNEKNIITSFVRVAIKKLPKELPFSFTDYILTLGVTK